MSSPKESPEKVAQLPSSSVSEIVAKTSQTNASAMKTPPKSTAESKEASTNSLNRKVKGRPSPVPAGKCVKCTKQNSKEGCTESSCIHCCEDDECEAHKRAKDQLKWKSDVLAGTTEVQRLAADKRRRLLKPGRFRETGFVYQGDSVVIWSLVEYYRNSKWRDDAIRRALKRQARDKTESLHSRPKIRNRRKRFHHVMEELYRQSLDNEET